MQKARKHDKRKWNASSLRLRGEVQRVGLRKTIISRANSLGISGWTHNSRLDENLVIGQFGGPGEQLVLFTNWLKIEMEARNINVQWDELSLTEEDLPLPAARFPNTPIDIDDRLDKGIELLVEMNETLKILYAIDEKMDKSLENQKITHDKLDKSLDNQEKMLNNQEITHDKLDKSLENQKKMLNNQEITHDKLDKSLENQKITHDKLDKSLENQKITHDKLDKSLENQKITNHKLDNIAGSL